MLPDFRFVLGAIMAVALLGVTGLGLFTAARLSFQPKMGPLETARHSFDDRADWNQFYDPESLRRFVGMSPRSAPIEAEQPTAPPPAAVEVSSSSTVARTEEPAVVDIAPVPLLTPEPPARATHDLVEPPTEATARPAHDAAVASAPLAPEPPPANTQTPATVQPAEPAAVSTSPAPSAPIVTAEPAAPSLSLPADGEPTATEAPKLVAPAAMAPGPDAQDSAPAAMTEPPPAMVPAVANDALPARAEAPIDDPSIPAGDRATTSVDAAAASRTTQGDDEVSTTAALPPDAAPPAVKPKASTTAKPRTARPQRTVIRRVPLQSTGAAFPYGRPQYQQQMFAPQQLAPRPAPQPAYTRPPLYRTDGFAQGWRYGG